jgi:hypothetical protein
MQNGTVLVNGGDITGTFCGLCGPPLVSTLENILVPKRQKGGQDHQYRKHVLVFRVGAYPFL